MTQLKTPFSEKKQIQAEAREAQSSKLRKYGAVGNLKRARTAISGPRKYGGSGGKFARGGGVTGAIEGGSSAPRGDRGAHRKGAGKGGTNITIAMMPHSGAPAGPAPGMAMPAVMPHPPVPMPAPGGAPGPMAGGPPMGGAPKPPGMAATGGAIRYARGGKIRKASGTGKWLKGSTEKADAARDGMYKEKHGYGDKDAYKKGGKVGEPVSQDKNEGKVPVGSRGALKQMKEMYGDMRPYDELNSKRKNTVRENLDDKFTHADADETSDGATEQRYKERNFAKGGRAKEEMPKDEEEGEEKMKPRKANEEHDEDIKLPGTGRGGKEVEDSAEKHFGRKDGGRVQFGTSTDEIEKTMKKMTAGASSGVGLAQKNGKEMLHPVREGKFLTNRKRD